MEKTVLSVPVLNVPTPPYLATNLAKTNAIPASIHAKIALMIKAAYSAHLREKLTKIDVSVLMTHSMISTGPDSANPVSNSQIAKLVKEKEFVLTALQN